MQNWLDIIRAVVELLLALASVLLVPYLKTKISAEKMARMLRYVDIAVEAAQQLYTPEEWEVKKKYVQAFLSEKGYDINLTEVDAAIESAVIRVKKELGAG